MPYAAADAVTIMAFDYGRKRIGVAIGQTVSRTATALKIVSANSGNPRWQEIAHLVEEWRPDLFVIGFPTYRDSETHMLRAEIEQFSRRLSGRYGRLVDFVDERLSSFEASDDPMTATKGIDAVAARLILMTWFEHGALHKDPIENQ